MTDSTFFLNKKLKKFVILRLLFWICILTILQASQQTILSLFATIFFIFAALFDFIRIVKWNLPQVTLTQTTIEIFSSLGFQHVVIPNSQIYSIRIKNQSSRKAIAILNYRTSKQKRMKTLVIWIGELSDSEKLVSQLESRMKTFF